jgi:hypothetical protein
MELFHQIQQECLKLMFHHVVCIGFVTHFDELVWLKKGCEGWLQILVHPIMVMSAQSHLTK